MAIRHYGLDEAEIEALEAEGKTDAEIADANRKRAKEQMDDEEGGGNLDFSDTPPEEGSLAAATAQYGQDGAQESVNEFSHIPTTAKEANEVVAEIDKILNSGKLSPQDDDALSDWVQEFYSLAMSRNENAKDVPYVKKPFPRNASEAKDWFTS